MEILNQTVLVHPARFNLSQKKIKRSDIKLYIYAVTIAALLSAVGILYIIMHVLLTTETLEDLWKKLLRELENYIQNSLT